MRVIGKLSPLKNATSTSGSLQTLASLTILPLASTMHTLDSSRDTSIPACCSIAILHLDARGRISIGPLSILLGDSYLTACSEQGPLRHLMQLSRFAGRQLSVDDAVFASESATGDR